MSAPRPILYTEVEGGDWLKWAERKSRNIAPGLRAHSIVFDNGRCFDMYNGWRDARKFKYNKKTGELIR